MDEGKTQKIAHNKRCLEEKDSCTNTKSYGVKSKSTIIDGVLVGGDGVICLMLLFCFLYYMEPRNTGTPLH